MHDLLIRGGTIVDGSGRPAFEADVAVSDGKITAIGTDLGPAKREIDASGLLVTPGWVDIHTHYDAQATWDPYLIPSSWHGVTTAVMGNCGVGFAPVSPDKRQWLIGLMEGVEDIPGAALTEGIQWSWESFPEYLDALDRRDFALDIGAQVPHGALRAYVMGERGAKNEPATPEDIERMATIVEEGLRAGALGFSTSRTLIHRASDGEPVPGTFAKEDELFGIGRAMAEAGHGVFQMTSNHIDMPDELRWAEALSKEFGLRISFNCVQIDDSPDLWTGLLQTVDRANAEGARLTPQVAGRPAGVLMGWECTVHPFLAIPAYHNYGHLPPAERIAALRQPEVRQAILSGEPVDLGEMGNYLTRSYEKMFVLGPDLDYEPRPERSIAAIAKATGKSPAEVVYDAMLEENGTALLYFPIFNYSHEDMSGLFEMLQHPASRLGLGDGGAHVGVICDASISTFMLTHWVRDRTRGPKLSLEWAVKKQTSDTAELFGLHDRGRIEPGYLADFNLIDFDSLSIGAPKMVYDLPANGKRLLQSATGYVKTIKRGQVIFENGEPTGAMPGGLLRGPQKAP